MLCCTISGFARSYSNSFVCLFHQFLETSLLSSRVTFDTSGNLFEGRHGYEIDCIKRQIQLF